jgi:hypothetical protein
MDPTPQQQNPLAGLMSLLGPNPATSNAAPQQQASPQQPVAVPSGGAAPTQAAPAPQGMSSIIPSLMGQSQQAMNAPMGQPVAPANPLAGLAQHPLVQGLLKAVAQMAQSYGWTAMMPQERLERTQMQQQKGEALSRLAETGAYQEGMLGIRGQQLGINQQKADTGQQRADTAEKAQASLADFRKFEQQNMQDKLALATDANQWKQEMAAGRLDKAQQMIDQKATQFEQKIALAQKQFGLEETKTALQGEGIGIKQGMLDLAKTALAQKGTVEGAQAMSKIQQFKIEHPILSQFMDMSDLDQLTGAAAGVGLPGVAPVAPTPVQPTPTGIPQPGPATPKNKAQAKKQQAAPAGGATHVYVPGQGIQPIGGQ